MDVASSVTWQGADCVLSERFRSDGDVSMMVTTGFRSLETRSAMKKSSQTCASTTRGAPSSRSRANSAPTRTLEISSHQRPRLPLRRLSNGRRPIPPEPTTGLAHQPCNGLQSTEASCIGHIQGGCVQLEFATSVEDLVLDHRDEAACRFSFERPLQPDEDRNPFDVDPHLKCYVPFPRSFSFAPLGAVPPSARTDDSIDRKSTRLNSSHLGISYAV